MQRHGSDGSAVIRSLRVAGLSLLLAHLLLVGWLTLRPLDVMWVTAPNWQPLAGIRAMLTLAPVEAARRIGGEVMLLAPLGVLLPLAGGRLFVSPLLSLARTAAAGALISMGIELLQTAVPGQVVDIDSLLLNTAGVVLVHVAVVPAGRAALRRRRRTRGEGAPLPGEDRSQGSTPTIPRVGIAPWSDALPASRTQN
ncbi:VanZ family protein [Streptomyces sannanensis]|uniref:VanZ family protein n=1 Tax=Streptomyces sannanensis TaxID=285536 RepID=UPI0031EFE957